MEGKTTGIILAVVLVAAIIVGGIATGAFWKEKITIKVFCAGSLTIPMEQIKEKFEEDHSLWSPSGSPTVYGVEVLIEPAGSVTCVRKITDIGKLADVLASADYTLILDLMMPDYADWYVKFARNMMVLAYSNSNKYANEINSDNWYEILRRGDVKYGLSNPNMDPCGYRSLMVIQLAELEYGDDQIFENLVEAYSAITVIEEGGVYNITAPEDLKPTGQLTIRDKSVDLIALVQTGGLDYAFEYSSVAKQHGLSYVDLPDSINLSNETYNDTYTRVKVWRMAKGKAATGKAIVYGVTVPKNAPQRELAEEFVRYMIDEFGVSVFIDNGQPPITPAVASDLDVLPEILKPYCTEE